MLLSALNRSAPFSTRSVLAMHRPVACSVAKCVRLAVVGDVHGQWCPERDAAALQALHADFTLFVGDFGNEKVHLVRQIAELDAPKAVILGNHDAWYSMSARRRSRSCSPTARYSTQHTTAEAKTPTAKPQQQSVHTNQEEPDRVQQQLDALGACHVGYSHQVLPGKDVSLVGARPFSKGGKSLRTIRDFMLRLYDVGDMQASADKILEVIKAEVPAGNTLILMGHNGPAGLGAEPHSICGVDWVREAGDHGDPDLESVLQKLRQEGRPVALVVFGHMHHTLRGGGKRQMVHIDDAGTVYLNAATVPRVVTEQSADGTTPTSKHHFLLLDVQEGQVQAAADVWVRVSQHTDQIDSSSSHSKQAMAGAVAAGQTAVVQETHASSSGHSHSMQQPQQLLVDRGPQQVHSFVVQVAEVYEVLRTVSDTAGAKQYWDAHETAWEQVVVPAQAAAPHVVM